jgi:hypothetical protein
MAGGLVANGAISLAGSELTVYTNDVAVCGDHQEKEYMQVVAVELAGQLSTTKITVKFINPCMDTTRYAIYGPTSLPNHDYTLFDNTLTWQITEGFRVEATIETMELCGGLTTTIDLPLMNFLSLAEALTYNVATGNFELYSEDMGLVGLPHTYTIHAHPDKILGCMDCFVYASGTISVHNPCLSPTSLTAGQHFNIDTDGSTPAVFVFPVITVVPSICIHAAVFSCEYVSGPVNNLVGDGMCLSSGENGDLATTIDFNAATGLYSFFTQNSDTYPEGVYEMAVTVTVGDTFVELGFTLTIHDHCETAVFTLNEAPPAKVFY